MTDALPVPLWRVLGPAFAVAWIAFFCLLIPTALVVARSWRPPALRRAAFHAMGLAVPSMLLASEYLVRALGHSPCFTYEYRTHLPVMLGHVVAFVLLARSFGAWEFWERPASFEVARCLYILAFGASFFVQVVMSVSA